MAIDSGKEWKSGAHKQEKSKERGKTGAEDADKLGREEVSSRIFGKKNKICQKRKAAENRKEGTDPDMKERSRIKWKVISEGNQRMEQRC